MGNRSAQKFLRSFRSGESYWMSANWTRNPSQRIKRLFGLQTGTFQLKHHYSVHAVWILWAGTNGTNTSAFEAMNIVKILGLSFDKKSSKDLRYGKVPTMFPTTASPSWHRSRFVLSLFCFRDASLFTCVFLQSWRSEISRQQLKWLQLQCEGDICMDMWRWWSWRTKTTTAPTSRDFSSTSSTTFGLTCG